MKKNIIIALAFVMALTSCGTYTGAGAGAGAHYGSWIGGLIGGISGGHKGYHVGELVGLASGAVVGAAIGSAKDKKVQEDYSQYRQEKARLKANREARQNGGVQQGNISYDQQGYMDSGFNENNSGDDRLFDFGTADNIGVSSGQGAVQIRNARFVDSNGDNVITRDEMCKVVFEVYNNSNSTLNNIQPTVIETTGNKHIYLSQNTPVGSLAPGKGIRYTVNVKADNRLKEGMINLQASVMQGGTVVSKVSVFNVRTGK